ncbi:MAG: hypothetical protein LUD27_07185 [Clostridia bacterium]|nr:hypothetical protein [Clostridia bacterium]
MLNYDDGTEKFIMRVLALLLCAACLITCFSSFFTNILGDSESYSSVTLTFSQGSAINTTVFSSTSKNCTTNASGCLVVPETYFNIYGETAGTDELAISVSVNSSDILDCETFKLENTAGDSYYYSFTGWHIVGATDKIPEQTVFQPGDVITPDILDDYVTNNTLELEALWGKCYFIQNAYTTMVYDTDSDGYYALDTSSSSGVTGASDDNTGLDPEHPKATIDGLYATLRSGSTSSDPHRDYDAYATVIMLTGDLDYYKDSNRSISGNYYRYYGYSATSTSSTNNGVSANQEYVSATYKSLQATSSYADGSGITVTNSLTTKGTKYSYYYKGHGSYNYAYGNFRFDNILFRKMKTGALGTATTTTEFQLFYPSGDTDLHYFETTARYNVYTESGNTVYLDSSDSAFYVFRTSNHQYIVLNGGTITSMEILWSADSEDIDRYWYIGRLARVNNYITCGSTSTDESVVVTRYGDWHLTVTGGYIGYITGSNASLYSTSVGDRYINVYGDGASHVVNGSKTDYEYNPYITNLYGGGRTSRLFGNVILNATCATNLISVYGGGQNYSATTYGNVTLNLTDCAITYSVYGGGQYANVEEIPSTYTQYTYANSTLSSATANTTDLTGITASDIGTGGDVTINLSGTTVGLNGSGSVYGSGMGQSQTITISSSLESHTITQKEIEENSYYYPTGWTTEPTFPVYDSSTGYILIGSYKYLTWTTASASSVAFRRYDFYAYLSLATVENVEINITDGSLVYGDVYGGGSIAKVLGDTIVNIVDSTVNGTVYGGGDGATTPDTVTVYKSGDGNAWTYTVESYNSNYIPTSVTISQGYNKLSDLTVLGTFTWSSDDSLQSSGIDTTNNKIYSANATDLGAVYGSTTVNITGNSTVTTVYGGGNQGAVTGDITLSVSGGSIDTLYGGCNEADVTGKISVSVTDATVTTLYGGNNASGDISGVIEVTVSQDAGTTTISTIYGGGNEAAYTGASITVAVSNGTIGDIYGGGYGSSASVTTTGVAVSGGSVTGSIYGGGNLGDVANSASVTLSGGSVAYNIYGGGLNGNVTGNTTVAVSGSTTSVGGRVYGGGYEGDVTGDTTVSVTDGTETGTDDISVFGGGENGDVAGNTTITVSGETASVYGGGYAGDVGGSTDVTVNGTISGSVFGGGYEGGVTGSTTVAVTGGTVSESVYGGGYAGNIAGNTSVAVSSGVITGSVYGGGYDGDVGSASSASSTNVAVTGGEMASVYGGGYNGDIYGSAAVSISDTAANTTTINGGVYGAGYGEESCVTQSTAVTIDLSYQFTATESAVSVNSLTSGEIETLIEETSGYDSVIKGSVYGGGNLGTVGEGDINTSTNTATISTAATTTVTVKSGHIKGSVYGGGYGVPATGVTYNIYMGTVFGETAVNIGGDDSYDYVYIEGNVFGGGSQSRVYTADATAATVNISSEYSSYIALDGSVFGGGERGNSANTNASVATTVGNVYVNITGQSTGATIYFVKGGVYGDGNLCLVTGTRTIVITNLTKGSRTSGNLKTFYSLQRADIATLSNSQVVLLGAVDLVAEGDSTVYSINRITTLSLTNGSTIKLDSIVNYLENLSSDVYNSRTFINGGYNGTNSYNSGALINALDSTDPTETSTYITCAINGEEFNGYYTNTVCVANGLSLELRTTNGGYGAVTGLFTLSLLYAVEGEGGGFVYADIANSNGDFICITGYSESYTEVGTISTAEEFAKGIYYTRADDGNNGYIYTKADTYDSSATYYVMNYMAVVDDVGGYTSGNTYTYYYWYIQGTTISYSLEVTGYIGTSVTDYDDSGTVPKHTATRYYVLHDVDVDTAGKLAEAVTGNNATYELVQANTGLTGQQISIEVMIGSTSLGFLYYDATGWGIYVDASTTCYGLAGNGSTDLDDNILTPDGITVTDGYDTISFVLHKSSEVTTELKEMSFKVTIYIYEQNGTVIGNAVSDGTSQLVVSGTANIVRLVPTQTIYKTTGKNYAGINTSSDTITITEGSSFSVQYQTKYIPAAFTSTASTPMTWALSTEEFEYYTDADGNYLTINATTGTCAGITATLTFNGGAEPQTGVGTFIVYKDDNGVYYYYTSYNDATDNVKVTMNDQSTTTYESKILAGTKITMIDLTNANNPVYYYYICSADTTYINLDSFYVMGSSTTTIGDLTTTPAYKAIYSGSGNANSQVTENLIFIFDFEEATSETGGFRVQLQHLYKETNDSHAIDMMDFVQTSTKEGVTSYSRTVPKPTEYTITSGDGYTLEAEFANGTYYDLDTAVLNVKITEDDSNVNTRLAENEYAIKIELIVNNEAVSFPVGMLFKYENNGEYYTIAASGTYVIIPVQTSGTHTIYIINELYSLMSIAGNTATFKVTLYSAPDASYYNYINWSSIWNSGSVTASYTIAENLTYALSVTATTGSTVNSQVLAAGETLDFTVKTACSDTNNSEGVEVALMKKNGGGEYEAVTLDSLFTNSGDVAASTTGQGYSWTISGSAAAGTYRLVFTYGDHTEYLNVIVY